MARGPCSGRVAWSQMKVGYRASTDLPKGVVVALVEGDREAVVLVAADASGADVAAALQEVIPPWAASEWLHVGPCGGQLRAVG